MAQAISILYPDYEGVIYKKMTEIACHDLALDLICKNLSDKEIEQVMIMRVISNMTSDARVAQFRAEVFDDIHRFPKLREEMMELLEEIQFLKDFGSFKRDYDKKAGIWDLLHRLEEISDYIICVEKISKCLSDKDIQSEGMKKLKEYVDGIYFDAGFAELKKDISELKANTSNIRSITLGINVDERFETSEVGIVSVNNKQFKSSGIVSNFARTLSAKDGVTDGNEWNGSMHFTPIADDENLDIVKNVGKMGVVLQSQKTLGGMVAASTIVTMPDKDGTQDFSHYLSHAVDQILSITVKRLRSVLSSYATISIRTMTELIPEFVYYIRFAEFIEKKAAEGYVFSKASVCRNCDGDMLAKGFYNAKLIMSDTKPEDIVTNDLDFTKEHLIYILTGANRGGKTTVTQAVGQLYVLAQGGIYIPGESFEYTPVDCIYTHFPADEDKTLDLGRLGEECTRFKDMYSETTKNSLILMNETFSTTSFEEGYYIARDSVKAILNKRVRTIYNTHMHKLAYDIDEINDGSGEYKAASLIVKVENNSRSFKVRVAPPEGLSYAKDIAEKYGVTYEMLTDTNK